MRLQLYCKPGVHSAFTTQQLYSTHCCSTMQARTQQHSSRCAAHSFIHFDKPIQRLKALQDDRAAVSTATAVEPAEQPVSTSQHTDARNDQAAFIQRLRKEAFEAGFKAGYTKGVNVQVSVSLDLDDDSGSYLTRRPQSAQIGGSGSSSSSSNGGGSNDASDGDGSSNVKQPWLPKARSTTQSTSSTDDDSSSSSAAGDSIVRSAVKGLVWRIFSTTATVSVALVLFQDSLEVSDALKFGGIEFAMKYVLYFLHERLWAAIALL